MKLTEKQIEDVFEIFYKELISEELKLIGRQIAINNFRLDLLFKDKKGKQVIVELKSGSVTRQDIGQLLQYAGSIDNSKIMLIAPTIPSEVKKALEHYGIDYMEFNPTQFEELYLGITELKNKTKELKSASNVIQSDYFQRPSRIRDGNIVFKVSFNDKNWSGICTSDTYKYNSFSAHKMFWCNMQANLTANCQKAKDSDLSKNYYPCYDSVANLLTQFTPGWNHGQDAPHICLKAKVGKIALLTSLYPESGQEERFIFTLFEIERVIKIQTDIGDFVKSGTEFYIGNPATAVKLRKDQYLNYWDFTQNETNNPRFKKYWGSGLFRYLNDEIVAKVLTNIVSSKQFDIDQKENAKILLNKVI